MTIPRLPSLTLTLFAVLSLACGPAVAAPVSGDQEVRLLQLENPARSTGIQIGDRLERRLQVEIAQPYQLANSALPIKGSNRDGIELVDIQLDKKVGEQSTLYTLSLHYQIFAATTKPAILQLPAEKIALNGGPKALAIEIPAWRFWFSPLAIGNIGLAKAALQPQAPPSAIALSDDYIYLAAFIALMIAGLVGLVYVHADRRWLPFMGGAFAHAYRQIRRLPRTQQHESQALLALHQAFDKINGASLFPAGIDDFIARHPQFAGAREEIVTFYRHSGQRLFSEQPVDTHFFEALLTLARRLRHCERGLA
jgi:mxaA protein